MTPKQFVAILIARWKAMIFTGLCVLVLGALSFVGITPRYKATASVVANLETSDPLSENSYPGSLVTSYQATQIAIITSDRVERLVAQRLQLDKRPDMIRQWQSSFYYRPDSFLPWVVVWLDKHVSAKPIRASDVIEISFINVDPQFAVDLSNAFAEAYLTVALQLNVEPAKLSAQWLRDQSRDLRANLAAAQAKLSEFQRDNGIVASDNRLDVENTMLTQLQQQLVTAQGQYADSSSREKQNSLTADDLPEVLSNPLINNLKSEIAQGQAQLEDMRGRLGTRNPQYTALESRLNSLKDRQAAEIQRVVGSLAAANRVSVGREAELREAIAAQKGRVLLLRDEHDKAMVLQNDVEAAQRAYDLGTERLTQATLKGKLEQTNVAILSPATVPYKPEWPTIPATLLISVFLGAVAGVSVALLREYLDPRIHDVGQAAALGNVPAYGIRIPRSGFTKAHAAGSSPPRAPAKSAGSAGFRLFRVRNKLRGSAA
jgi:chain length determinant protein EpsF